MSKSLVFLIGVRESSFLYIFFFNDTLFAPLNFYSDFYCLITGLICAWVLWITDIILMDKKDRIMLIIGQLNKHARIQEVSSEWVQLWRFFCFVFSLMRGGRIQIPLLTGASETPFKWCFAGGPMMAQHWMLDWYPPPPYPPPPSWSAHE